MKIFITGDNHLGRNLKKRKALRDYAIRNFKSIPEKIGDDIDYVVFAGDIFDKDNADIECHEAFVDVIRELINRDTIKRIFIITGNHDSFNDYYNSSAINIANSLDSAKIVSCSKDYMVNVDVGKKLMFCLIPWTKKLFLENEGGRRNIIEYFNNIGYEYLNGEFDDYYKIMISHFPIKDWMPFAVHGMTLEELKRNSFFDLTILGDLHNEELEDLDKGIIYTGSTMHTSIEDLKRHDNVAKIIEIEDNDVKSIERVVFDKPSIMEVTADNVKDLKEDMIAITSDISIHMKIKDSCIYSLYKPLKEESNNGNEQISDNSGNDTGTLDIQAVSVATIDSDQSLQSEEKEFIKSLLTLDTDSLSDADIQNKIEELMSDNNKEK